MYVKFMHKRQDLDHVSIFMFFESSYLHKIESKSQLGKGHIPWPVRVREVLMSYDMSSSRENLF